ncbi:hypothetical protein YPPY54_3519, partial [Yersinia pestis PY-54]
MGHIDKSVRTTTF